MPLFFDTHAPHWQRYRWPFWLLAGVTVWLAVVAMAMRWHHSRSLLAHESVHLLRAGNTAPSAEAAVITRSTDFVSLLPMSIDTAPLLQSLRVVLGQQQATLMGLQVQSMAADAQQLQRTDVLLRAQGSYANLKQLLGDLSQRYPEMTVPRLKMRSGVGSVPGVLELDAVLQFWAQPTLGRAAASSSAAAARKAGS